MKKIAIILSSILMLLLMTMPTSLFPTILATNAPNENSLPLNQVTGVGVSNSNTTLPNWLEKEIALMYPNASSTKLNQVRTQVIEQIAWNQKRVADTHGAVLNYIPSTLEETGSYMSQYLYSEPWNGGEVYYPDNMEGLIDYNYAEFYTPELYQNAAIVGQMNSYAGGDVYIVCKLGPSGAGHVGNTFNVWVSNSSYQYGNWSFVGSQTVTEPYNWPAAYLWIGDFTGAFSHIVIGVVSGDEYHQYNDVVGDVVWTTNAYGCRLSISTGEGGTTDPSPGNHWYDPDTTVQVTVNPYENYVFDHWILDGEYCTENPITVTMTQSQHYLQAYFTYVGEQHTLTMYSHNQDLVPSYVPLYIDYQYVGTTGYSYAVTDGNHEIYVESPVYDGYYSYFWYYQYDETYNYDNPMTLSVTSDITITAVYWTYY